MDDNRLKFGVGVLVIAAIGIGIILTFLFGAVPRVLTGEVRLLVQFPTAEGINSNSPVLLRGVEIGRVIDKELRENDVLLTIGIDPKYQNNLTHEYLPKIKTKSIITGDAKLEFVKGTEDELLEIHKERLQTIRSETYTHDQLISYGTPASDPFSLVFNLEDEVRETLEAVQSASGSLQSVGDNVNQLVQNADGVVQNAEGQVGNVAQDARNALIEFQGAMRDIRNVIGNPELRDSLAEALRELPLVLTEAQTTLQSTQRTFESFERVGQRFENVGVAAEKTVQNVDQTIDTVRNTIESAERAIVNVETITKPIAANSDELVDQVLINLKNLDRTLRQVETFGVALNNSNGTVRRLLEDDDIYWQVRRTIENVELATAKIRPILDDVRIFSDKIARDPRQLGVKGALDKRGSGLGLK
ncbi:MlaD family protein [Stieleria sp. ICT_E10.1]|uniref:MlaD family protein n=1 Tax=Stieleria sedimenti TaxID=2976331 RepID=UPI00217F7088|nr:MlaD family protein [Stieleria sedimenti]MCS7468069.1 MlaD family protein [Stieleria sedimenti]